LINYVKIVSTDLCVQFAKQEKIDVKEKGYMGECDYCRIKELSCFKGKPLSYGRNIIGNDFIIIINCREYKMIMMI